MRKRSLDERYTALQRPQYQRRKHRVSRLVPPERLAKLRMPVETKVGVLWRVPVDPAEVGGNCKECPVYLECKRQVDRGNFAGCEWPLEEELLGDEEEDRKGGVRGGTNRGSTQVATHEWPNGKAASLKTASWPTAQWFTAKGERASAETGRLLTPQEGKPFVEEGGMIRIQLQGTRAVQREFLLWGVRMLAPTRTEFVRIIGQPNAVEISTGSATSCFSVWLPAKGHEGRWEACVSRSHFLELVRVQACDMEVAPDEKRLVVRWANGEARFLTLYKGLDMLQPPQDGWEVAGVTSGGELLAALNQVLAPGTADRQNHLCETVAVMASPGQITFRSVNTYWMANCRVAATGGTVEFAGGIRREDANALTAFREAQSVMFQVHRQEELLKVTASGEAGTATAVLSSQVPSWLQATSKFDNLVSAVRVDEVPREETRLALQAALSTQSGFFTPVLFTTVEDGLLLTTGETRGADSDFATYLPGRLSGTKGAKILLNGNALLLIAKRLERSELSFGFGMPAVVESGPIRHVIMPMQLERLESQQGTG